MKRVTDLHKWLLISAVLAAGVLAVLFMRGAVGDPTAKSTYVDRDKNLRRNTIKVDSISMVR
jgi:hypothetical protein